MLPNLSVSENWELGLKSKYFIRQERRGEKMRWDEMRAWLCWVLTECAGAGLDSSAQLSRQQMETHTDYQTAPSHQSPVSPLLSCGMRKIIIFLSSVSLSCSVFSGQQIKQPIQLYDYWSIIWNMTPLTISNQRDLFSCSFFTDLAWSNLDRSHSPLTSAAAGTS